MTPDAHTIREFFIDVGNEHQIYVHEWGNPKGAPVIFLHGGPGDQSKDRHKRPFDPTKHRVIFFDQRGGGKSLPSGNLEHNTTNELIEDISKIADEVKMKKFVLYGTSWGTTLALAYAVKYPARIKALVLCGIFTGKREEIDWIAQGKFRLHFPEVWETYLARTPKTHHDDPSAYHYKNILGKNDALARSSAIAVEELEYGIMSLDEPIQPIDPATYDPSSAKILAHYFTNNCFLADRHIMKHASKLTMPIWIVHGRFDMDCPPITAYELSKKLPNGHLIWAVSNHRVEHENTNVLRTILLQVAEKS
jgi:proline iminopeptidase